jgi:hypothetical protein
MITPIFAAVYAPDWLSLTIAGLVVALGVSQFTVQLDRARRPDVYFKDESERDRRFLVRQAKRRVQLSIAATVFGVFLLVGLFLSYERHPQAWGIVWLLALLFLGWAGCLAIVDFIAIRIHFGIEIQRQRAEKLVLDYRMRQFQEQSLRELEKAKQEAKAEETEAEETEASAANADVKDPAH